MTETLAQTSGEERREFERKKLIVDLKFEGGDATGIANTRDIGIGGLYMTTAAPLNVGDEIIMTLSLEGRSIQLSGVIVYSDPGHGVGVRFKDIEDQDMELMKGHLNLD